MKAKVERIAAPDLASDSIKLECQDNDEGNSYFYSNAMEERSVFIANGELSFCALLSTASQGCVESVPRTKSLLN